MNLKTKLLLSFAIALFASGCSPSNESLAPVRGTVLMDGQPLARAKVNFMPKNGGRPGNALTDQNGKFSKAGTFEMGDGAPVGENWVVVTSLGAPPMDGGEMGMDGKKSNQLNADYNASIPIVYGKPELSGFSVTVKSGSDNEFTFELDSSRKK